jgi:hypothetical protein
VHNKRKIKLGVLPPDVKCVAFTSFGLILR